MEARGTNTFELGKRMFRSSTLGSEVAIDLASFTMSTGVVGDLGVVGKGDAQITIGSPGWRENTGGGLSASTDDVLPGKMVLTAKVVKDLEEAGVVVSDEHDEFIIKFGKAIAPLCVTVLNKIERPVKVSNVKGVDRKGGNSCILAQLDIVSSPFWVS